MIFYPVWHIFGANSVSILFELIGESLENQQSLSETSFFENDSITKICQTLVSGG